MIFLPSKICTYLGHLFHWLRLGQALPGTAECFPRLTSRLPQLLRKLLTLLTKLRLTDFLYRLNCAKGTYIYLVRKKRHTCTLKIKSFKKCMFNALNLGP